MSISLFLQIRSFKVKVHIAEFVVGKLVLELKINCCWVCEGSTASIIIIPCCNKFLFMNFILLFKLFLKVHVGK